MSHRADIVGGMAGSASGRPPEEQPYGVGPASSGGLWVTLDKFLDTARAELDRHGDDQGVCVECGAAWPRDRAALAAFTLEAVSGR